MEEADFLREMEANPGSAEHALHFADWLEENGKPAHAEVIRLHHTIGGHRPGGYHKITTSGGDLLHSTNIENREYEKNKSEVQLRMPLPTVKGFNQHPYVWFRTHVMKRSSAEPLMKALIEEGATGFPET